MDVGFVAFDLDGTLLNSKKELPAGFREFVSRHDDLRLALASGRQYYALKRDFGEFEDRFIFICDNGSFVFDRGELIYESVMDKKTGLKVFDLVKNLGLVMVVCGRDSAYMAKSDIDFKYVADTYYGRLDFVDDLRVCFEYDGIAKIALFCKDANAEELFKQLPGLPLGIGACVSGSEWIDVSLKRSNKGEAVRAVLAYLGIDRSRAMCFGDYMNDYEMFRAVDFPVAMANGCRELKDIAWFVTSSNDEDGVMRVLMLL